MSHHCNGGALDGTIGWYDLCHHGAHTADGLMLGIGEELGNCVLRTLGKGNLGNLSLGLLEVKIVSFCSRE